MTVKSQPTLEQVLDECRTAAREGYDIARSYLRKLSEAISAASESLSQCLKDINRRQIRTSEVVVMLDRQLSETIQNFAEEQRDQEAGLEEKRQQLDKFSIALFGRTLAGKSTLMEILTGGDGRSIGTGAQRTTRDVRSYSWKGLTITDVPGTAAFEGAEEDEAIAFEAAEKADLVIFLITDDAPQPAEARCFERLCRLGKPILGICNVKAAVDDEDDLRLFLRDPDRYFDRARLDGIVDQFNVFISHRAAGGRTPFLYTHLRSRFLANLPQYAEHRDRLLTASRFNAVESHITGHILNRGRFFRFRNFIEGVAVRTLTFAEQLLRFGAESAAATRVFEQKHKQFLRQAEDFMRDGRQRIRTTVSQAMNRLRHEVPGFVEEHYDDSSVKEKWENLIQEHGICCSGQNIHSSDFSCCTIHKLQAALQHDCGKLLADFARALQSEMRLVGTLSADHHIEQPEPIFDSRRAWRRTTSGLAAGLGLAALFVKSGPLGWIAAIVGGLGWAISFLFESREEKARRAREKLKKQLETSIDQQEKHFCDVLLDWFDKELVHNRIGALRADFEATVSAMSALASSQRALGWELIEQVKSLTGVLVEKALAEVGAEDLSRTVRDVARVPGAATMLSIPPRTTFPVAVRRNLERLLGEHVWFVEDSKDVPTILSQSLARNFRPEQVRIERGTRTVHLPLKDPGPASRLRVRLAQQLIRHYIMLSEGRAS